MKITVTRSPKAWPAGGFSRKPTVGSAISGVAEMALGVGFFITFVVGFCLSLNTWRPMLSFWIVTAQRLAASVADPRPSAESRAWFMNSVAMSVLLYLGFVMLTVVLPIPRLGVTTAVRDSLGLTTGGLWPEEPHRVVVLAGLYYFFRGWATAGAFPRRIGPNTTVDSATR